MKIVLLVLSLFTAFSTISWGNEKLYLAPYMEGHPECDRISDTRMECQTNEVNKKQPGESEAHFLDRETEWDLKEEIPSNCVEQNNHILICNKNSNLPPVPLL